MPIGGLQELKSGLRTAAGIDNDVLLAALKRSPATAPLAAARTQELITNLLSSEYGSQGMHGQRWREFDGYETKGLSEEAASLRRQLQDAKAAARSAIERLETEAMQRQHADAKAAAAQHRADQTARDLQEAHIARMAAENKLAEMQVRQNTASTNFSQQVHRLEQARQSSQAQLEECQARLHSLEAAHQQHLAACSAQKAAAAEREAALEQQRSQARNDASIARSEADSHRAAVAAAQTRLQALEQEAAGAKARQAAAGAQLQELQGQLRQAEAERREAREKYVTLGRRYEGVHAQEAAARMGIQEAVRDLDAVTRQRDDLAGRLQEAKQAACKAARCVQANREEIDKLRREANAQQNEIFTTKTTIANLESQVADAKKRAELLAEELQKRKCSREEMRAQLEREAETGLKLQVQQKDFEWRQKYQELELRVRHLASNDVVANPSDYITKAEHARILDSRLAAKDYEAAGELARRVASMEREAALRLAAREAELQETAAAQLRKVQHDHDAEKKRSAADVDRAQSELQRALRDTAGAHAQAETARAHHHRIKEEFARCQEAKEAAVAEYEEAARQLAHLQHQLTNSQAQSAHRERSHLQEETLELKSELAEVRASAAAAEAAAAAELRAVKKKHEAAMQALEDKVEEAHRAREAAQQRAQEAGRDSKAAAQQLEEAEACLGESKRATDCASHEAAQAKAALKEAQADVARSKEQLSSQAAAAEAAMKALRQECDKKCAQQKRHITHATAQMSKQVMQLRSQQAMLRTAFEGELQRAAAECTNGVEALQSRWRQALLALRADAVAAGQAHRDMVAAVHREEAERTQQLLADAQADARRHEQEAVAQAQLQTRAAMESLTSAETDARLQRQLLSQLVDAVAGTASLGNSLQHALANCETVHAFSIALQQLQQQIRGWADDYALQKVLVPIERALPEGTPQGRRTSARMSFLGSPGSPLPGSLDASLERRVAKVVAACGACAARIKDLEAAVKAGEERAEQVRAEGGAAAVQLREEAVQPLRTEVGRMRQALADLQSSYSSDISQIKAAAEGHVSSMKTEAEDTINQIQSAAANLQAKLGSEIRRADGLSEEVARLRAQAISSPRKREAKCREVLSGAGSPQMSSVSSVQAQFSSMAAQSPGPSPVRQTS